MRSTGFFAPLRGHPAALWLSVGYAVCGTFQFGYQLGVLNLPMSQLQSSLRFSGAARSAVVVAAMLVGGCAGAIASGPLADSLSPRRTLLLANAPLVIGVAISTAMPASAGWPLLASARVLIGLGVGVFVTLVSRYLAEIAPVDIRGTLGTLNHLTVSAGVLFSFLTGVPYGLQSASARSLHPSWWRVMFALSFVPCLAMAALWAWAAESPLWLAWKGRDEDAAAAYAVLRAKRRAAVGPAEGSKATC